MNVGGEPPADGFRRRRAWERAKEAFGSDDVAEQLTRLERCPLGCPRLLLAACVDHFLRLPPEGRYRAVHRYLASLAFPREELIPVEDQSPEEFLACEQAFEAAMRRVMAQESGMPG